MMYRTNRTDEMTTVLQAHLEDYLGWPYLGGAAGALVLTGVAAYFATKPSPETPLMPLDCQSRLLPVSERSRRAVRARERAFIRKSLIEFHGNFKQ